MVVFPACCFKRLRDRPQRSREEIERNGISSAVDTAVPAMPGVPCEIYSSGASRTRRIWKTWRFRLSGQVVSSTSGSSAHQNSTPQRIARIFEIMPASTWMQIPPPWISSLSVPPGMKYVSPRCGAETLARKHAFKAREGFDPAALCVPSRILETPTPLGRIDEGFLGRALAQFR